MIYPLLPLFLSSVLGASAGFVGVIEGAAESTASLLKLASGWWSDRVAHRKSLVVVAVARSATDVLAIRLTDRVGKGIRTTPRDALLAESTTPETRGRAFGFHAAADNFGAVLGPLVAFFMLAMWHASLRTVFWWSAVPGIAAFLVLVLFVRERPHGSRQAREGGSPSHVGDVKDHLIERAHTSMPGRFWVYLVVVLLFTLGNSTDAFLLLRAHQLGVPVALAPVLWAVLNFVKSATGTYGGGLSDRLGRRPLIVAGWVLYAAVYAAFAWAGVAWEAWVLFAVYGVFYGMTEGTEKALVVDLVPGLRKGTALGWYNLAVGLGALPASLLFGAVWDRYGSPVAFTMGAGFALVAALGMLVVGETVNGRVSPR
jgi:MFS family permease